MSSDQPPENSNGQSAEQNDAAPKVVRGCVLIPDALSDMLRDSGLPLTDWGMLVRLLDLCRYGTRYYYGGHAKIAEGCRSSRSAVGRSLSRLAKAGLI